MAKEIFKSKKAMAKHEKGESKKVRKAETKAKEKDVVKGKKGKCK